MRAYLNYFMYVSFQFHRIKCDHTFYQEHADKLHQKLENILRD